ncbi:DUF3239 domain-containing protein [Corynebacterium mayonis]|uniref:DUF3239 domain-containing protein n=1 Tax=Corynebacterium mayonis TaxID=3062461 RepID=UPI0031401C98
MSNMKVFRFEVDEQYAKEHNEMLRDTRSLKLSGISLFIISLIAGVIIWLQVAPDSPWRLLGSLGLVLFGVTMLIVGILIPKSVGSAQKLYDTHPIAPAVVAKRNGTDYVLLALVNTNVDPALPPRWAVTARNIRFLPQEDAHEGAHVPVVAIGGQRSVHSKDQWQTITPMPIAWGTPDYSVVSTARKSIPRNQWEVLEKAAQALKDVRDAKNTLIFVGELLS